MDFEWDEDKRRTNVEKHGVDLLEEALIFEGDYTSRVDDRRDYGEKRFVSIGMAVANASWWSTRCGAERYA